MSMFSIASSKEQSGSATVAEKGYRLTTSRSIGPMPAARSASICEGSSRRASRPAWIFGCRVFTRPPSISAKPVYADTSVTARPSFCRSRAVPPVERISTPSAASARANSTTPDLSETLTSARFTFVTKASSLPFDAQLLHLGSQRGAVDSEHRGRVGEIALGMAKHGLDHRLLDVLQHHLVDRGGRLAVHVLEIALQRALDGVGKLVGLAHAASLSK